MVVILIPAYKPDEGMLALLNALIAQKRYAGIVVVDDGSGLDYRPIFEAAEQMAGVVVVRHAVNQGKGRALKTGFNAIMNQWPEAAVITADADGQHTPRDIGKGTPAKSLMGNTITRYVFALSTGKMIYDTQTGLRGIPASLLPEMMHIPGERYEYEMNMLLQCVREGVAFKELEIETVYLNNNASSHFHPVRDAMLVFSRVLSFAASSLICFAVDYGMYAVLLELAHLAPGFAQIGARVVSSILNFFINRNLVFRTNNGSFAKQLVGYYALVLLVMGLSFVGVEFGTGTLHGNDYVVKIIVDILLSVVSFLGQRLLVFRPNRSAQKAQKA